MKRGNSNPRFWFGNATQLFDAARLAGVSRLADVTGLDEVGLPVWQAVRPASRALSVHQGKGLTEADAIAGALGEAIESDAAEHWDGETTFSCWDKISASSRPFAPDDFAKRRGMVGISTAMDWTLVENIGNGPDLFVPADAVSFDFTRAAHPDVLRNSCGQAAGPTVVAATRSALLEVLERDALGPWLRYPPFARSGSAMPSDFGAFAALEPLMARLRSLQIRVRWFRLTAVIPIPVIGCLILDRRPQFEHRARAMGVAARPTFEAAAVAAIVEALQSRLTRISGSRDDLPEATRAQDDGTPFDILPLPTSFRADATVDELSSSDDEVIVRHIVAGLCKAGYPQVGRVHLNGEDAPIPVVKCFVPGLGSDDRHRRMPL